MLTSFVLPQCSFLTLLHLYKKVIRFQVTLYILIHIRTHHIETPSEICFHICIFQLYIVHTYYMYMYVYSSERAKLTLRGVQLKFRVGMLYVKNKSTHLGYSTCIFWRIEGLDGFQSHACSIHVCLLFTI